MIKAGGVIFLSLNTHRICLLMRGSESSWPHVWGFPGGKIHKNERILQGVSRELREEIGQVPEHLDVIPIDIFYSNDQKFIYHSFVVLVSNEFVPILNNEHCGWGWFDIGQCPKPLHPGAKNILANENFTKTCKEIIANS